MGGTTPVWAIPYPYQEEVVGPQHFEDFADAVDTALDTINFNLGQARSRPYLHLTRTAATSAASGTETDVGWVTERDNSGAFTWVGTGITLPTPGLYAVSVKVQPPTGITTVISESLRVKVNGTYKLGRRNYLGSDPNGAQIGLSGVVHCITAAHVLGLSFRWHGTGGPATIGAASIYVTQLVDLS